MKAVVVAITGAIVDVVFIGIVYAIVAIYYLYFRNFLPFL